MAIRFPTQEEFTEFQRAGMLHLPDFFPQDMVAAMADLIWADLQTRFGIDRHQPETWAIERPAQFQSLVRSGTFDRLGGGLTSLADAFLGAGGWQCPRHIGQVLVTFPTAAAWDVPHNVWHIDIPSEGAFDRDPLPWVRTFVLLNRVRPKGGGTCYVEASHRVIDGLAAESRTQLRSVDAKERLNREKWFAELFSGQTACREQRFMIDGGTVRGIAVRAREIVGEPGDVYVMHPTMLHTIAPNSLDAPRMMVGQTLERRRETGQSA